jgi:hypothetical protein
MTFSVNNRLILETYTQKALEPKRLGGIATPGQKDGVKGLRVLMDATISDGRKIPKGSLAYIKEEVLYNHSTTIFKSLTCDTMINSFMIVDQQYIEFFDAINEHPDDVA